MGTLGFRFKLDPFFEQIETLEKMGAERPGVLVFFIKFGRVLWKINSTSISVLHP